MKTSTLRLLTELVSSRSVRLQSVKASARRHHLEFFVGELEKRQLLATYSYDNGTGLLFIETDANNEQLSIISTSNSGNYTISTNGTWTGFDTGDVSNLGQDLFVNSTANLSLIQITNNAANAGTSFYFGDSLGNSFIDNLNVNFTQASTGTITVGNATSFINGASLNLSSSSNAITVNNTISANSTGCITFNSRNISVNAYANITTQAGDIALYGNGGGVYQTGSFQGVAFTNITANVNTSGGNIIVNGRAGASGRFGVNISQAKIQAGGNGTISITGISGNGGSTSTGIYAASSIVTTANGSITMTGVSNSTGSDSRGIHFNQGTNTTACGSGSITLTGIGGTGSTGQDGMYFYENAQSTGLLAVNGNISLYGTARSNSFTSHGVYSSLQFRVRTTNGNILVDATANASASAVYIESQSFSPGPIFSSQNSTISFIANSFEQTSNASISAGTGGVVNFFTKGAGVDLGGADSTTNLGLSQSELGLIKAGLITIGNSTTGQIVNSSAIARTNATLGTNLSLVTGSNITISSGITVNGTFKATGNTANSCISVAGPIDATGGSGSVSLTGRNIVVTSNILTSTGDIALYGNGGGVYQSGSFDGVNITGQNVNVSSTGGNITLDGRGASDTDYEGITIDQACITTGNRGALTFIGVSGNGGSTTAYGILANSTVVRTVNGTLTLTGTGYGVGIYSTGVGIQPGSNISTTGTGNLTISGNAASGTNSACGIHVLGSSVTTANGTLSLTGTSFATGTSTNGIFLDGTSNVNTIGTQASLNLTGSTPGNTTTGFGINANIGIIGSNGTGILITANSVFIGGSSAINATSSGSVTIQTMGLGVDLGGMDSDSNLGISQSELDSITAGMLTIGNGTTGAIVNTAGMSRTGNLTLISGSSISQNDGSLSISQNANFQSAGNITLNNATNNFTTVNACGTNITIEETNEIRVGLVSASGNLTIVAAAGAITQASGAMNVTGTANFVALGNAITLNNSTNDFGTVLASGGAITVNETNSLTLGTITTTGGLTVNGNTTNSSLVVSGPVTASGSAGISLTGRNVAVNAGITTSFGNLTIYGNGGGNYQTGSFRGVDVCATISSTAGGNIILDGRGGTTGGEGVYIYSSVLTSNGTIDVTGNANVGKGVAIQSGTVIANGTLGAVRVTGTSGVSGEMRGMDLWDGMKINTSDGPITLTGTSRSSAAFNISSLDNAIWLESSGSANVTAGNGGTVTLTGYGTGAPAIRIDGKLASSGNLVTLTSNSLYLVSGTVNATSAGNVLIQTLGAGVNLGGNDDSGNLGLTSGEIGQITANLLTIGNGTTGNIAVTSAISRPANDSLTLVANTAASCITVGSAISVTGTGGISLTGRNVQVTGNISTAAGDLAIYGNGGGIYQAGTFHGVNITGPNVNVNSTSGNITLDGRGSSGTSCFGILILNASVSTSGNGSLSFTAVSSNGSGSEIHGIEVNNSTISTNNGLMTINGTAYGTGTDAHGVDFRNSAVIRSTGTGNVVVTGTSMQGAGYSYGVLLYQSACITTTQSSVNLTGYANGSGTTPTGIYATTSPSISVGNSGSVNLAGYAYNGTSSQVGILVNNGGMNITSVNGSINLTGVVYNANQTGIQYDIGRVGTSGGSITLNGNEIVLGSSATFNATSAGDVNISSSGSGNISLNVITAANLILNAPGGNITATGLITTAGWMQANASGCISFSNASNDFNIFTANGNSITVNDLNNITLGTIQSTGAVSVTAANILAMQNVTAVGNATFTGNFLSSGGDRTLTGSTVTFYNAVNGGGSALNVVGDGQFGAGVSNLTSFSVTGNTTLVGNVSSSGSQAYNGSLVLAGDVSLSSSNSNIAIAGQVDRIASTTSILTSNGTWTTSIGISSINLLVVGGGGGGGLVTYGGGGGGGQVLFSSAVSVSGPYRVVVGSGGAPGVTGARGGNSSFGGNYTANGGSGGKASSSNGTTGYTGGGGSGACNTSAYYGSTGSGGANYSGGNGYYNSNASLRAGGGGGGAGSVGGNASNSTGGNGGNGVISNITGNSVYYGGGGGGGGATTGNGGLGGGGNKTTAGTNGLGGGGGASRSGGSGVVIISTISQAAGNLTINAGSGSVRFGNGIASGAVVGLEVTGGNIQVAGNLETSGNQTYHNAITLLQDTTMAGPSIFACSTANGGGSSLTITGNAVINGDISNVANFSVSGTTKLAANVGTTGVQTYTGAVTVTGNLSLTAANSSVNFNNTVDSGISSGNLTISSGAAVVNFAGAVGQSSLVPFIAVNGTGGANFSSNVTAANVNVSGPALISSPAFTANVAFGNVTLSVGTANFTGGTISGLANVTGSGSLVSAATLNGGLNVGSGASANLTGGSIFGATTSNGTLNINATLASLTVNTGTTTVLSSGHVTGPVSAQGGNLNISRNGQVTDLGINNSTVVNNGTIYNDATIISGSLTLLNGSTQAGSFNLYGGSLIANATIGGNITAGAINSSVQIQSAGIVCGTTTVDSGSQLSSAGSLQALNVTGGAADVTGGNATTVTVSSGSLTATGGTLVSLGLSGSGTANITNGVTVTGQTTVSGTAALTTNATLSTGLVVNSGTVNTYDNGTSINSNNLTLGATSTWNANGSNYTTYGTISAPNVNITTGANLTLGAGFTMVGEKAFTLINNTGSNPVSGTFYGKPEGSRFAVGTNLVTISYRGGSGGNDVVLYNTLGNLPTTVTSNTDLTNPSDGIISLREAINYANLNSLNTGAPQTITFDLFGSTSANTITLQSGPDYGVLSVSQNSTISIAGPVATSGNCLTISGNDTTAIFSLTTATNISNLTLVQGYGIAGASGGAINNNATTTLTGLTVKDNFAYYGGGVYNGGDGHLTISSSTFANNTAAHTGGAIDNAGGSITLSQTTIAYNSAADGGGIDNLSGSVSLTNTIVANNTGSTSGPDIKNSVNANYSLISDTANTSIVGVNNLLSINPLLGSLGHYGGNTKVFPLLPGSPAINSGTGTGVTDQRGITVAGTADMGAFQSRGFLITKTGGGGIDQVAVIGTAFPAPLALNINSTFSEPVVGGVISYSFANETGGGNSANGTGFNPPLTATIAGSGSDGNVSITAVANNNYSTSRYTALANATGANAPASYLLKNVGLPANMTIVGNNNQTLGFNSNFTPFTVKVRDSLQNVVPYVTVSFSSDTTAYGATAKLASNLSLSTWSGTTNLDGNITSATFKSNAVGGAYGLTASAGVGAASAQYRLVNLQPNIQSGTAGRSFVNMVAGVFGNATLSQYLANNNRVKIEYLGYSGANTPVAVNLANGTSDIAGNIIWNYGTNGITGNPNTQDGDGVYQLAVNYDGTWSYVKFHRLFGDTSGDGVVDTADYNVVIRPTVYGKFNITSGANTNGQGQVYTKDVTTVLRQRGRRVSYSVY